MIQRAWRLCAASFTRVAVNSAAHFAAGTAVTAAVLLALFVCASPSFAATQEDVEYNGKVYSAIMFSLSLDYPCLVEKVLVTPGDQVQAGQALARYRLKNEAVLSISNYLERGLVRTAEANLVQNDIAALTLREEYATAKRLSAAQMGSADRLNNLQQNLTLLRKEKTLLEKQLKADRADLSLRRQVIKDKLGVAVEGDDIPEYGELRSTQAGEVLLISPDLREGMLLHGGLPAAVTLARTNPMEVRTQVFEAEIPHLKVGGKAIVKVVSLEEREYEGVITLIDRSPGAIALESPSYYNVHVDIANDDGKLRVGYKALVRFLSEKTGK